VRALFFLALFLGGVWLWRSLTTKTIASKGTSSPESAPPTEMVQCAHCGVHLPASDAFKGHRGAYCSQSHQQLAEG